jgi:hypothetical protein
MIPLPKEPVFTAGSLGTISRSVLAPTAQMVPLLLVATAARRQPAAVAPSSEPCRDFGRNQCNRGEKCRFSHAAQSQAPLRRSSGPKGPRAHPAPATSVLPAPSRPQSQHPTAVPNSSGKAPAVVPYSGGRAHTGQSSVSSAEPARTMPSAGILAVAASPPATGPEPPSSAAVSPPAGSDPAQLLASSKEHAPLSGATAALLAAGPELAPSLPSASSSGSDVVASAFSLPSTSANLAFPPPTMTDSPSLSPASSAPSSPAPVALPATPPGSPQHEPTSSQETIVDDVGIVSSDERPKSHALVLDPQMAQHLFWDSESSEDDSSEPVEHAQSRALLSTSAVPTGPGKARKIEIMSSRMDGVGESQGAKSVS